MSSPVFGAVVLAGGVLGAIVYSITVAAGVPGRDDQDGDGGEVSD